MVFFMWGDPEMVLFMSGDPLERGIKRVSPIKRKKMGGDPNLYFFPIQNYKLGGRPP